MSSFAQPSRKTTRPHPVILLRPPFIMPAPQLPDQTPLPHRPARVQSRRRRLLLPRTSCSAFNVRCSMFNVRCSLFPFSALRFQYFRFQHFSFYLSAPCSHTGRCHLEKPVQRPLPNRQLRLSQPPPPLHLRHEHPRRPHRRPLPRPLAKTQIFHNRQPIRPPLQILEPNPGQNIGPLRKPDPCGRR